MNIAIVSIYGDVYANDRMFDPESCKIGENLLVPIIKLKEKFEKMGHQFHTADVYELKDIDVIIFQDLNTSYKKACVSFVDKIKYIVKAKKKNDYLEWAINNIPMEKRILIMQEPPIVCPSSYLKEVHKYFGKILTWNDELVDEKKYYKFCYPQVVPNNVTRTSYNEKKLLTMICGNKLSKGMYELYSERRRVIDYFENNKKEFDLYGVGWERENLKNYNGKVEKKLNTLSGYKFAVCLENMYNINGYITEKIFDCFFASVVPIYWGANNITDYIPEDTYIDYSMFSSIEEMYNYLENMSEAEYDKYIDVAKKYLQSATFKENFSVNAYVDNIIHTVLG